MWQQKWKIKVRDEEIFQTCPNDNKNMLQRQTSYKLWSFVTHKLLTFEICWYACLSSNIRKSLRESPRESLRKSHNIEIYRRVTDAVKFHPLHYIKNCYITVTACPQCKTYPKHMSLLSKLLKIWHETCINLWELISREILVFGILAGQPRRQIPLGIP